MITKLKHYWWLIAGAVLVALVPFLVPAHEYAFWIYFFSSVGITIILALSLNLALGYTGLFSMAHSALYAIGAYASAVLVTRYDLSFWVSLPLAILITAGVGALMTLATLRASNLYFAMITLAFALIIQEIARVWSGMTGGLFGLVGVPKPQIGDTRVTPTAYYYLVWGGVALSLYMLANLISSRYGRAFRALKLREEAATALGVAPLAYKTLAFTLSAGMAGLAGVLFVHLSGFVAPEIAGLEAGLTLFVGVFLGGVGTLFGPVLVVLFATAAFEVTRNMAQYQQLLFGCIMLLTIFLLPSGLIGAVRSFQQRRHPVVNSAAPAAPERFLDPAVIRTLLGLDAANGQGQADGPLLAAQDVRKSFGGLQALKGVDLAVQSGTIHGLIGPNGSGKSTLIGCLTAYHQRNAGTVYYHGQPLPEKPYKAVQSGMVRVFQIPHLFDDMTVLDNVLAGFHLRARQNLFAALLGLPAARRSEAALRRDALALLDVTGMADKANLQASQLPHGQKRMLEVIRALAARPRLLILDEPATGLVTQEVHALGVLLQRLRDAGITILLVEHNMSFVMKICDCVTVLEEGSKIAEGTPAEIQRDPQVIAAYLGESAEKAHLDVAKTVAEYA